MEHKNVPWDDLAFVMPEQFQDLFMLQGRESGDILIRPDIIRNRFRHDDLFLRVYYFLPNYRLDCLVLKPNKSLADAFWKIQFMWKHGLEPLSDSERRLYQDAADAAFDCMAYLDPVGRYVAEWTN